MISFVIFSWEALISEDLNIWNLIFRLLLGFIIGVIIGARQEKRGRPAGLRTYIIISVGSTMLMILSIYIAQIANVGDPGRIAAQVVSGIGFLGAGAIIKSGVNIAGMTTAASIWTTAALGLCAGSGLIILAGLGTIVVISTLSFVRKIEKRAFKSKKNLTKLIISFRDINIKSVFQN
ncbi:MAG: MgtC/SapB family protein, partial [Spirochaetota bacterium]